MRFEQDTVEEYLEWLKSVISLDDNCAEYSKLLDRLFKRDFYWSVDHDENRSLDGVDLREEFVASRGYDYDFYEAPCSCLEMMVALSIRCQDELYDPEEDYIVGDWFWGMVWNIGFQNMDNNEYDEEECDILIDKFLDRRYARNGTGGLFMIHNPGLDMRKAEIWYQMNAWLMENFVL